MNNEINDSAFYLTPLGNLRRLPAAVRTSLLVEYARILTERTDYLIAENARDLENATKHLSESQLGRLKLDVAKLNQVIQGISSIALAVDPVGQVLERTILDDELVLDKIRVPLGVVGVIFESRPDVFPQLAALAIRSANAIALKGGKEARYSNEAFLQCLQLALHKFPNMPQDFIYLSSDREIVAEMIASPDIFSLVIPRGSKELVETIMRESQVAVLGHADGVCAIFVERSADLKQALGIIIESKTAYPSACNAVETILVDDPIAVQFLSPFADAANQSGICINGCPRTLQIIPSAHPADATSWTKEYGSPELNIKVVRDQSEAVQHINTYGSHHTDAIVSADKSAVEQFLQSVDSASVFANCSTRFADGYRYGLGAEIGIGTGKIHARGPVGIEGLLTYKYLLRGAGQLATDYVGAHAKNFRHEKLKL